MDMRDKLVGVRAASLVVSVIQRKVGAKIVPMVGLMAAACAGTQLGQKSDCPVGASQSTAARNTVPTTSAQVAKPIATSTSSPAWPEPLLLTAPRFPSFYVDGRPPPTKDQSNPMDFPTHFQVAGSAPSSRSLLSFRCQLKPLGEHGQPLRPRTIACDSSRVTLLTPNSKEIQRTLRQIDALGENDPRLLIEDHPKAAPEELAKILEKLRSELFQSFSDCSALAKNRPATPTEEKILAMYRRACLSQDFQAMLDARRAFTNQMKAYTCRLASYREFTQAEFIQKDADTWTRTEEVACGLATYVIWRYPGEYGWNLRADLAVVPNQQSGAIPCSMVEGGPTEWRSDTSFLRPVGCRYLEQ